MTNPPPEGDSPRFDDSDSRFDDSDSQRATADEPVNEPTGEPANESAPADQPPVDPRPRPRYGEYAPVPPQPRYGERLPGAAPGGANRWGEDDSSGTAGGGNPGALQHGGSQHPPQSPRAGGPSGAGGAYPGTQGGSGYPTGQPGQQPGGYPGQQGGYPSQQGGYPGQQGGYPGQQGGAYPGQQPGQYPGAAPDHPGAPSYDSAGWSRFDPAPAAPKKRTLGLVALIIIIVVFVLSVIASAYVGASMGPLIPANVLTNPDALNNTELSQRLVRDAPGVVIVLSLQVLIGTVLGILSLILGIAASARRRGRAFGIIAIVLSLLAPVVSFIVYITVLRATIG